MELNAQTSEQLLKLCDEGDVLVEQKQYDAGIKKYEEALNLLPTPNNQLEATTWVYAAIGDAYYLKEDFEASRKHFIEALNYRGGMTNAFILLRLGQCWYHTNNVDKAKKFLMRAYNLEGVTLFEDEDPIYLTLIEQ